jgi:hypothetical protein
MEYPHFRKPPNGYERGLYGIYGILWDSIGIDDSFVVILGGTVVIIDGYPWQ